MIQFDLAVVGGSAAGLCAAIQAARGKKACSIAVLERMPRVGKKILATGNGRCNLSNIDAGNHPYHNAGFARQALTRYNVENTLTFFKSLGLLTVADSEGRIYPMSNTAASVLDALRFEAERLHVNFLCNTAVKGVSVLSDGSFAIRCLQSFEPADGVENGDAAGTEYFADNLIIAAGGKASPVHGSDGSGYDLLRQTGHSITPLFPALVQIVTDTAFIKPLKGIRAAASIHIEINGKTESAAEGEILFTEYGLSGIAAMEVSRLASEYFSDGRNGGCFAILDLAPELHKTELTAFLKEFMLKNPTLTLDKLLIGILPGRVGQAICRATGFNDSSVAAGSLTEGQFASLIDKIKALRIEIKGVRGFDQAQITAGGADVSEFDPHSLMSCKVEKLYACGEVLDVDGNCGGFNLQWAWSSGLLAGELA